MTAPVPGPIVGFDLDMTLVDSAAGIVATLAEVLAELGVEVTSDQVWPTIGAPLRVAACELAPDVDPDVVVARYRELYPRTGVTPTALLPGAVEALRAVHALGGRVLVISAKVEPAVRAVLRHVGLDRPGTGPDLVVGGLFAAEKGERLAAAGAQVYVGDHPGDVEAARVAGAVAVAVATGPHGTSQLMTCSPDVILPDLTRFPAWLAGFEAVRNGLGVNDVTGS
jgi:phosphoglycolate phosphatase